jgi:hypothetical protein
VGGSIVATTIAAPLARVRAAVVTTAAEAARAIAIAVATIVAVPRAANRIQNGRRAMRMSIIATQTEIEDARSIARTTEAKGRALGKQIRRI